jgi:hypothetical protein
MNLRSGTPRLISWGASCPRLDFPHSISLSLSVPFLFLSNHLQYHRLTLSFFLLDVLKGYESFQVKSWHLKTLEYTKYLHL